MGTRRGNSEGSIVKRADGRWMTRLTLDDGTRKTWYAKTRAEAVKRLTAAMRDRDAGLPIVGEKQTVAQYLTAWLEDIRSTIRPRSWVRYEEAIRLHILPTLGSTTLSRLTAQQLQGLYTAKLKQGLAPATVARIHAVVRRVLVKAPRPVRSEMRAFTPDQARAFLAAVEGHPMEAFYVLALTTGMRRGELLALHWADVNLEEASVQVRFTVQHLGEGRYTFTPPKSPRSRRKIALTARGVEALRTHQRRQVEQLTEVGTAWHDEGLVFTNALGYPLRGNHILERDFLPILVKAQLPRIRLHDLRHTAATLLLLQGINPKVVAEMLGHSTVSMTLDTYSHVLPDMQKHATVALDRLLDG